MKKIIFYILFVSSCIFSENKCEYTSDPSIYERSVIKLVNKYKLENKIYCTNSGDKLIYQTGDIHENMQIGLTYHFKNYNDLIDNFIKVLSEFSADRDKLIPNNLSNADKIGLPRYYHFRMYVFLEDQKKSFMFFDDVLDTYPEKGEWMYYINEEFKKTAPSLYNIFIEEGYFATKNIIY